MQAFTHLTLLAFLFIIAGTANTATNTPTTTGTTTTTTNTTTTTGTTNTTTTTPTASGTTDTTPAPATPTTAAGTTDTTPAPATPTTAAGTTDTTPAPATPTTAAGTTDTTPAPATPTTAAGTTDTTPAPATPTTAAGTTDTTPAPATPTTAAGTTDTTPAPATPTTAAGTTDTTPAPATPTTAAGTTDTTPAPATPTTAAGTTDTTPAPATPTTAAGTTDTTPAPATPTTAAGTTDTTPAPATPTTAAGTTDTTPAPATPTTAAGTTDTTPAPATPTTATGTTDTTPAPASATAPTTIIKGNSPGTIPSVTFSSVTSPQTSNPNADTTSFCQDDSCSGGSSCVKLNKTHFCLCIDGYYYNSSSCKKGKVFPGIIQVETLDTSDLENEKSINYEKLYVEVKKFFEDVFSNSDYGQTVIQQVRVSAPARSQMRADDKVVDVTVVNLFAEDTKENETTISTAILNATSSGSNIKNYTKQDRCEFYGCEKRSEQNDCSNGFQCKCRPGYERPNPYTATCLPSSPKCPDTCNSEHNMQCLVKDSRNSDCVCLAGYKKDDHGKCQACAFGYNGVNCEDNFQLILTVVGTIAGILILGMVIALIFMRSKKTKDIEEQNLIENDFQNLKLQQTTGFSSPAGGSIFPKITASFPGASGMQNPYENPRGIPRPDY